MEKLIELLNEYEETLNTGLHWKIDEKYGMLWRGLNLMGVEQFLISKQFGFIKWLVENDKIDYQKSPGEIMFDDLMGTMFSLEDSITMMLSISDTPIEDLISYLK